MLGFPSMLTKLGTLYNNNLCGEFLFFLIYFQGCVNLGADHGRHEPPPGSTEKFSKI